MSQLFVTNEFMITKHVCSLELSKQLYEAGIVVKNPEFVYYLQQSTPMPIHKMHPIYRVDVKINPQSYIPAPLSSELGELLPKEIVIADKTFYFIQDKDFVTYHDPEEVDDDVWSEIQEGECEVNARAKMLLYLKQRGLYAVSKS